MMFTALKALKDQLASVPAFSVDAETRLAILRGIQELEDAMVMDVRAYEDARRERMAEGVPVESLLERLQPSYAEMIQ